MSNRFFGDQGESVAEIFLKRKGYQSVCKNFRTRIGEIDIIVMKGDFIIFCEVKTRKGSKYGKPFEAVNKTKQKKIRKVAQLFLQQKSYFQSKDVRFDVISIFRDDRFYQIEHIIGAF